MIARKATRGLALVTLVAFLAACATTSLPPISASGAAFEPERDERALWRQSREEERKLLGEFKVYADPLLEDYLDRVAARLTPAEMAANPEVRYRVTVLENPTLNAFAYPHGSLYVHTGMLSRTENEDQLATVLGHEMTHVENRHMLRYRRAARNRQYGFLAAAVVGAVILAGEQGEAWEEGDYSRAAQIGVLSDLLLGLGLKLAFIAAVNGYGRDLEREADEGGFEKLRAAGYDVDEAPRIYEILSEDHGEQSKLEGFFFGSHPRLSERIESAKSWIASEAAASTASEPHDRSEFIRRLRPVIRDDARMNLELGRLGLAEAQLDRALEMMPEDSETHFLIGRLRAQRAATAPSSHDGDAFESDALAAFQRAIELDADHALAHRELGLIAYRQQDFATACRQFRRYTELEPKADDAQRMRDYVRELERDGHCPD
ncbi:MAG: M48 family metalloprotease [Acidobacteriota bacterium]|nr:MAG: M48 family metalloprotease [Acidobacteriota bacterium]